MKPGFHRLHHEMNLLVRIRCVHIPHTVGTKRVTYVLFGIGYGALRVDEEDI